MEEIILRPIGVVRSEVSDPRAMPQGGVPATIEVYPEFAQGLEDIESNTHLQILAWLGVADRGSLLASQPPRGVFGLRSPARPNPIGLTPARLLGVEGRVLHLERLDFVDGTPVLDIKRYSPGWDCIFSARSSRDLRFDGDRRETRRGMLMEAANFHGEECVGVAMAVRMIDHATATWRVGRKAPELRVWVGSDGCVADGLQALSGATLGNGRLKVPGGRVYRIAHGKEALVFYPLEVGNRTRDGMLDAALDSLFTVRQEVLLEEKPIAQPKAGTADPEALVARVRASLVNGKLPCAVAYRLADELGVHVSEVGHAADAAGVKISLCQLGCFR